MKIKDIMNSLEEKHRPLRRKKKDPNATLTDEDENLVADILKKNDVCLRLDKAGFINTDEITLLLE